MSVAYLPGPQPLRCAALGLGPAAGGGLQRPLELQRSPSSLSLAAHVPVRVAGDAEMAPQLLRVPSAPRGLGTWKKSSRGARCCPGLRESLRGNLTCWRPLQAEICLRHSKGETGTFLSARALWRGKSRGKGEVKAPGSRARAAGWQRRSARPPRPCPGRVAVTVPLFVTLRLVDFDFCGVRVNARAPPAPEGRNSPVGPLPAASRGAAGLCPGSAMPLPRSQGFFCVLIPGFL